MPASLAPIARSDDLLVTRTETAAMLRKSLVTLDRMAAAGKLPPTIKVGGSTMWRRADLVLWIEMGCPDRAEFEARKKASR